jgi:hypothetical protein
MINNKKYYYALLLMLCFLLGTMPLALHAQDTSEEEKSEEPTEEVMGESVDDPAPTEDLKTSDENPNLKSNKKKKEDDGKKWYDIFLFWQEDRPPPATVKFDTEFEADWHLDVARYEGVRQQEFYRYGYALRGNQWYPVFFLRRFNMMRNQYEHFLVINGRPEKIPRVKGIQSHRHGIVVTNEGFEFQMPTVASVSRQQKTYDEEQALSLAKGRLMTFGFQQVTWVLDRKEETKDLAESWDLQSSSNQGDN